MMLKGGNSSEGGTSVGVRQPVTDIIYAQSLSFTATESLKYGTSGRDLILSMGPESDVANLVMGNAKHQEEK